MPKDVNIHLKTTGAELTKEQIEQIKQHVAQLGYETTVAGEKTEKGTGKISAMGGALSTVKEHVLNWIGAFAGIAGVNQLLGFLQDRLESINKAQKDTYDQTLKLASLGQRLEFQTGTRGAQDFWTQEAIAIQKAGALPTPDIAQQMLLSMDVLFAGQGGIKNEQIRDLAKQLAPFVGAANLGPEDVSKIFEFAGTAQIAPTPEAYKQFFAQLQAGFTASKAVNFGSFMTGLQQGGTGYLAMGGTLTEAISTFSAARAVMANEALASTLVEQVSRLSSGGYEKPRQAIEKALGIKWEELPMDQRAAALLQHVKAIPERQRAQTLAEQGFPLELTTALGKMVSPEATRTLESTRRAVTQASPDVVDSMSQAYLNSIPARARVGEAESSARKAARGPRYADWQERMRKAQDKLDELLEQGKDLWYIPNQLEAQVIALEQMYSETTAILPTVPENRRAEFEQFRWSLENNIRNLRTPVLRRFEIKAPQFYFRQYKEFMESLSLPASEQPPPASPTLNRPSLNIEPPATESPAVVNNFDYRTSHYMILNPVTGMNKQDLGIEPPWLG